MPDTRSHRGSHSEDDRLFAADQWPCLRAAVADLSWLLGRDYAVKSAGELVGNRYQLTARQRIAVERCACASTTAHLRVARRIPRDELSGRPLWIDGYNVLLTVEVALGGGVVLGASDSTFRDVASIHGTYRAVEETLPALRLLGQEFLQSRSASWTWWFDRPVSNSGRLKTQIETLAAESGWAWTVELVVDPDPILSAATEIVATADSVILDRCGRWYNLARTVVEGIQPKRAIVELSAFGG